MAAVLALLPQIIALIPSITVGVGHLINWIGSIRSAAQQSGEWTPDLERQFIQALLSKAVDPAWQPDPPSVSMGNIPQVGLPVPAVNAPEGAITIVKTSPTGTGREIWCNASGDCWMVRRESMIDKGNGLYVDPNSGIKFWLYF